MTDENDRVISLAASCRYDPDRWSRVAFDWGRGELAKHTGPRSWQRDINREIRDHLADPETRYQPLRIAVASGHGIGKALRLDAIVPTPAGDRLWGGLQPGDLVFGQDGLPAKIKARRDYDSAPMFRVTFDDGTFCDVSSGHLWNVRGRQERRNGLPGWRTMETVELLRVGVKRANGAAQARQWEIPSADPVKYPVQDVPIDPYVLGLWLGDGGRNSARITGIDACMLPRIAERGYTFSVGDKAGTEAKSIHVHGLAGLLRGLGVLDKYSYEKAVPRLYMQNSENCRAEVLRGLLDTDGEAAKHGSIVFSSCSEQLARDVVWLARSLGGKARISPSVKSPTYPGPDGKKMSGRPCYRAVLTMPHGFRSFYIERKQERVPNVQDRYLARWIERIEPIGIMPCMCITVDREDGLYLANDFIVTHNSAEMGMVANWAMSCWNDAKVLITSNTGTQLETKTSPEVSLWFRRSITAPWFDTATTSIKSRDPEHVQTWRLDFVTWSEHNTEAFAGLHNEGRIIVVLFDEASGIADKVWEVALGALTDENTVIIWIAFGNPTMNTGMFRECFRKYRHRWITRHIDSRDVEGTNKQYLQQIVDDNGEDSDVAKVRVRGQFPSQSVMQFISEADVDAAQKVHLRPAQYEFAPVIIGVDPAWTGDDSLEIYLRQGLMSKHLLTLARNDNDVHVANVIARLEDEHEADAVFVDAGYGTGIVSAGQVMGRNWRLIWFGGKAINPGFFNKRAEMWGGIKQWLKAGGAIDPADKDLYTDLTSVQTVPHLEGKIQLMSKKDMKEKLSLPSPNRGDALALTFAEPVVRKPKGSHGGGNLHTVMVDYDPLSM